MPNAQIHKIWMSFLDQLGHLKQNNMQNIIKKYTYLEINWKSNVCAMPSLIWVKSIWAVSWQNQHSGFATSMDPDQPAHSRSLIRTHAVRYQFRYL
jgi:hypothetical protein